ncbi:MAG: bifunctional phosphoribosylaminoimidazolecarboxamide formyltransferase/IMP cyclohydrolase [Gloeobacterales cyanobacterium]
MTTTGTKPRQALLSVSDKMGLVELARTLVEKYAFHLISSGGTAKALMTAGIPVTEVSAYTGSPEILDGRVKTLHPKLHGGILGRTDLDSDLVQMEAQGIVPIELVVVNLYPFESTVAKPDVSWDEAIENIDIGGPSLTRSAAKNHQYVTVLTDPSQYEAYLEELNQTGTASPEFRRQCAMKAFTRTADYDRAISTWFTTQVTGLAPLSIEAEPLQALRYGENPHQSAVWYSTGPQGWTMAHKHQGKELSFNNLMDLEASRRIVAEFLTDSQAAAVIIKHMNPCGIALGESLHQAYTKAYEADSVSAFGGIIALSHMVDEATAQALTTTFLECVVAPGYSPEALAVLSKKTNLRILELPDLSYGPERDLKPIAGGILSQASDNVPPDPSTWQVATVQKPTPEDLNELLFAWRCVKHVKSNAIVVTRGGQTVGIGAGQMNRVGSAQLALKQAGEKAQGAVLASDGFFPFDDTVRAAAAQGIWAIVQPGGSVRDQDSIKACDELGLVMVLTGIRHFLH